MTLEQEFVPGQVLGQMQERFFNRMSEAGLPPEDIGQLMDFLMKMAEVATQLILQERVIQVPNAEQGVPYDGRTAMQTMVLFSEGMYFSLLKSYEMGIPDDLRNMFLQSVAQYVYDSAKQMVVSTYGQENTPELQIPEEQQIGMVNQTAESALLYFVNEHEKQNGPIPTEPKNLGEQSYEADRIDYNEPSYDDGLSDDEAEDLDDEPYGDDFEEIPSAPIPTPARQQAVPHTGAHPHDKYAAMALIMATLSPAQSQILMNQFTPDEQALVAHYQNPANVEAELDVNSVAEHLVALRDRIRAGGLSRKKTDAGVAIANLAGHYSSAVVQSCVVQERSVVQAYLKALLAPKKPVSQELMVFGDEERPVFNAVKNHLPPKVEASLFKFLSRQIHVKQAAQSAGSLATRR